MDLCWDCIAEEWAGGTKICKPIFWRQQGNRWRGNTWGDLSCHHNTPSAWNPQFCFAHFSEWQLSEGGKSSSSSQAQWRVYHREWSLQESSFESSPSMAPPAQPSPATSRAPFLAKWSWWKAFFPAASAGFSSSTAGSSATPASHTAALFSSRTPNSPFCTEKKQKSILGPGGWLAVCTQWSTSHICLLQLQSILFLAELSTAIPPPLPLFSQ